MIDLVGLAVHKMAQSLSKAEEEFLRGFMDYNGLSIEQLRQDYELEYGQPSTTDYETIVDGGEVLFKMTLTMRIKKKDKDVTGTDEGLPDQT